MGQLIAYLEPQKLTLLDQLETIYINYGYHCTLNSYYLCYEPPTTDKIFKRIREFKSLPNTYPVELGGVKVINVRDLTTGFDSKQPDQRAILPTSR